MTRRRRLRALLLALALAGLALVGAGLFPQEPLRRLVEDRLRAALGPDLRLRRLHVVPALLRAELEGLEFRDARVEAVVPRGRLEVSLGTLLGRELVVEALEIESPRLLLRTSGAGGPGAAAPALFVVRQVAVRDAQLAIESAAGRLELRGLEARGSLGGGLLTLRAGSGGWSPAGGGALELRSALARVATDAGLEAHLEELQVETTGSRLEAHGRLGPLLSPRLGLDLTGRVSLAEAQSFVGRQDLAGELGVTGRVDGPATAPSSRWRLDGRGLEIAEWPVDQLKVDLAQDGAGKPWEVRASAGAFDGRLVLDGSTDGEMVDARVDVDSLDAERLRRRLAAGTSPLPGRLSGQARVRGPLDGWMETRVVAEARLTAAGQAVTVKADGRGRASRAHGPDLALAVEAAVVAADPAARLAGVNLSAQGRLTAQGVEGDVTGTGRVRAGAEPQPVELSGRFAATREAWSASVEARPPSGRLTAEAAARGTTFERLAVEARGLPAALLAPGVQGEIDADLDGSGPLQALEGTIAARGREITAAPARVGAVSLEGRLTGGRAELTVSAADLATTGRLSVGDGRLQAGLDLAGLPLERLAGGTVAGRVAGRVDLALPLARPALAQGRAQVASLSITREGAAFASREPFEVELAAGQLRLAPAVIAGPGAELGLQGTLDLEDHRLAGELSLAADLSAVPLPEGLARAGRVAAQARLGGSVERPEATGDLSWRGVELAGGGLPGLRLDDGRVILRGRVLELEPVAARWAGGRLQLTGALPAAALWPGWRHRPGVLGPDEAAALRLEWQGLQVTELLAPPAEEDASELAGQLDGSLAVEGGLAAWGEAHARLVAPATVLSLGEATLRFSPLDLELRAGLVRGTPLRMDTAAGQLVLDGQADLARRRADLELKGELELRALSALLSEAALTGQATVDLRLRGPLDGLRPQGRVRVHDGGLRLRLLPQAVTGLQADLELDEEGILRLPQGQAELGGGTLLLGGQARVVGASVQDLAFALSARDASLSYPPGLRSRLDADLRLTGRSGALLLAGKVTAQRGRYDLDQALASLAAASEGPSPLLRSVGLQLDLAVERPLRVASQRYAFDEVTARGQIGLRGDLEAPLPYGRLELGRGGTLELQGRQLRLQQGLLTYEGSWDARLRIDASARVQPKAGDAEAWAACRLRGDESVDVTATVSGSLELPEVSASSPRLPQPGAALSLLVTGRCDSDFTAVGGNLFVADLLASPLGALRRLGLDEVSIQPQLLARDTDPGARFTFGKRIGPAGRVIYSTRLNLPSDQWVRLEMGPWRTLTGSVQREEGGLWNVTAGQRLEWGGASRPPAAAGPRRPQRPPLEAVRLEGDLPLPEARLRDVLDLKPGQRAGSWTVADRADTLREWLQGQGYLEAEVSGRLDGATARVQVQAGPRYTWRVSGAPVPAGFAALVRSGLFLEESLELGRLRLERDLRREGRLQARVRARVEEAAGQRVLVFEAEPGPVTRLVGVDLLGARALGPQQLLDRVGGARAAAADLTAARRAWLAAYRERHYLAARVDGPRLVSVPGGVRLEAAIDEGPVARVISLEFPGATLESERLAAAAGLQPGDSASDSALTLAGQRLRDFYLGLGYPEARVALATREQGHDLAVRYVVEEGPQSQLRAVEVEGLRHTRGAVVLGRAGLALGQPLDPRRVLEAEQRVQALGSFASVSSETDAVAGVVRLRLQEAPRFLARYELSWQEQRGLGGQLDAEVRHLLGRGLVLGGRYERYSDVEDRRGFLNLPFRKGLLLLSAARLEERLETPLGPTTRLQRELRLQQATEPARWWKLLAGYRFKRVTVEPIFPLPVDVAALEPALLRDSRDNPLDPHAGRVYSLGLTYAESWLGSDFRYAKGLGQVSLYDTRGAVTWAQGYRLGLGWGFGGQSIVSSERFKAGGAGSLRGFGSDSLGPVDVIGEPRGGEAVVLVNQELRWRHPSGLGAVAFYDGGNVFDKVGDLSFAWRHALGLGLRYASPVGLLRLDLGFPLARREGEKSYQLFFSLGQAF